MTTLKHLISSQGAQLLGYLNLENTTIFWEGTETNRIGIWQEYSHLGLFAFLMRRAKVFQNLLGSDDPKHCTSFCWQDSSVFFCFASLCS